jgi:hypothetical protein
MRDIFETLAQIIVIDIFKGYGLYSVVFIILSIFSKRNELLNRFDEAANRIVVLSGILYALSLIVVWLASPMDALYTPYRWEPWIQPAIWILVTQLLWVRKIRQQKIIRIVFSILLIVSFEMYVIIVTSFHRDYIPSGWTTNTTTYQMMLGFILKTLIFCLISYLYLYSSDKLKGVKTKES